MAINWRRAMTQDRAYTAPPQYRRADDRSGAANVGPTQPTNWRRAMTQDRAYTAPSPRGTGLGQAVRGVAGNVRDSFLPGIVGLGQRMFGGITQNLADHRYLDSVLDRDEKNRAFWDQAAYNYGLPGVDEFGISTERPGSQQFGKTDTGTSLGQAMKYFDKAGLTQNVIDKFSGAVDSKWKGNEAWLSSQARDQDAFKTGMSFIKNAKATANLRRNLEAERDLAATEGGPFASGIEQEGGGPPSYDVDPVISAIDYDEMGLGADPENDILYGEPDGVLEAADSPLGDYGSYLDAGNLMPGSPVDTENLKRRAVFGNRKTGVRGMGPEEKFVRGFEYGDVFDDYDFGQAGMDDFAGMTGPYTTDEGDYIPGDTRYAVNRNKGTRAGLLPGARDEFYMNRIGDVINQGPMTSSGYIPVPNIDPIFEEEEIVGPRRRLDLYD